MRNPLFNADTVQAAMLKHELSLIPQRAAFAAALASCGPSATPAMVAQFMLPCSYPLAAYGPEIYGKVSTTPGNPEWKG